VAKGARKAVAYLRVSKGHQELGPKAQRAAINRFAAKEGLQIVAWHEDTGRTGARSGALPIARRPGLQRALGDLQSGDAGVLLVDVRDRLTRELEHALEIRRKVNLAGGRVLSACGVANGETDQDKFLSDILFVIADAERRRASTRIRAALAVKRSNGEDVGQPPFGFCNRRGKLVINPREERALWAIASLRRRGYGYKATCDELTRCGVFNRTEMPFDPSSVRRICQRLSIVASGRTDGPLFARHVELARPLVWRAYQRALREAQRIHPASSRRGEPPRQSPETGRFDRLQGLTARW
jgi:DNA invertase Pin-like site-specific DNA recombinase